MRAGVFIAMTLAVAVAGCERLFNEGSGGRGVERVSGGDIVGFAQEPPGANCPHGGIRVDVGTDHDGDGVLQPEEAATTEYVCEPGGAAGQDALLALVHVSDDPPACAGGGQLVETGFDTNGNGVLDPMEVVSAEPVCNGDPGASGTPGTPGMPGADALRAIVEVSSAELTACPFGGSQITTGLDLDASGTLEVGEVENTRLVCNGQGSVVGAGNLGGIADGTPSNPEVIDVEPRSMIRPPEATTLAAGMPSYYTFTTYEDPMVTGSPAAPYTFTLLGLESRVAVELFSGSDFSTGPLPVTCDQLAEDTVRCQSDDLLVAAQSYYLRVTEIDTVGNAYFLSVALGGNRGNDVSPVDLLAAATASMGEYRLASSTGNQGTSYYGFTPPSYQMYTVRLENIVRLAGASGPGFAVSLWTTDFMTEVWNCADWWEPTQTSPTGDFVCALPKLDPMVDVVLVVDNFGEGSLFDLVLEDGDTYTPIIPLGGSITGPDYGYYQIVIPPDGAGTLAFSRMTAIDAYYSIYSDRAGYDNSDDLLNCWNHGCNVSFTAGEAYYVEAYADFGASFFELEYYDQHIGTGTPMSPQALTLDMPATGFASDTVSSYFSFTTPASTQPVTWQTTWGGPYLDFTVYSDPGLTMPLEPITSVTDGAWVSPPLAPATTYYLEVTAQMCCAYAGPTDFTLSAGDILTESLGVNTLGEWWVPRFDDKWVRVDNPAQAPVRVNVPNATSGFWVRLFTSRFGPVELGNCYSGAQDCEFLVNFPAGSHYIELDHNQSGTYFIQLIVEPQAFTALTLGMTVTGESLVMGGEVFYGFTATGMSHDFTLACVQANARSGWTLYRPDGTEDSGTINSGDACSMATPVTRALTGLSPGETYFLRLAPVTAGFDYDITVQP